MGFFDDLFENRDVMAGLLGVDPAAVTRGNGPTPSAPPPQMSGGMMGEVLDPRGGGPRIGNTPAMTGPDGTPMMPPPSGPQVGPSGQTIPDRAGPTWAGTLPPGMPTPGVPAPAPGQPAGPTMEGAGFPAPPPGSAMAMPGAPGTASTMPGGSYGGGDTRTTPPVIPTSTGPTPGHPLNITPINLPPPSSAPPPTSTAGGLDRALGLANGQQRLGSAISAGMAGLGHGLSAVGQMHPGAPGAQAFAAGAGGALQGGQHQLDVQQAQRRQAVMDNFLMSSTKFKDMLAAQHMDNETEFKKMQGEYFSSRAAEARARAAGGGSNAYQNTPFWKTMKIEDGARANEHQWRIAKTKEWHDAGTDPATIKKETEEFTQKNEAWKARQYKSAGIDPDQVEKEKTRGQFTRGPDGKISKANPFDTKDFHSMDEFHATVPPGAIFLDEKGELKIKKPGPGAGMTPTDRSAAAAPNYDDYIAGGGMSTASDGEPA